MSAESEGRKGHESDSLPEISFTRGFTRSSSDSRGGTALWESVAGEWRLMKSACAEGFDPGSPPLDPGNYEGEIVKKLCELIVR